MENAEDVKNTLRLEGYKFKSDTDTEVLVNLISFFYKKQNKKKDKQENQIKALKTALKAVEGTYGLAVIFSDNPKTIYGARMSSPLLVGVGDGENFLASDANALPHHISKVVYLEDGQLAIITNEDFSIQWINKFEKINEFAKIKKIKKRKQDESKGEHSCFMEKEIFEQGTSIRDTLRGRLADDFSSIKLGGIDLDKKISRVLFLGCGTAYHAGLLGKYYVENISGIPASVEFASEYKYKNSPTEKDTLVVVISQSGETIDTISAVQEAKERGLNVMAVTNVVSSSLAREVPEGVYQRVGAEYSVASTKAFTSQITILLMMAVELGRKNNISLLQYKKYINSIRKIPDLIEQTLTMSAETARRFGVIYSGMPQLDFLGRQYLYPIALEASLKLKELTYIDSHGYPSGEIKHGPLATVARGRSTFFIATQESIKDKNISNMKEVKARDGGVYLVKQKGQEFPSDCYDEMIEVPKCPDFISPILSVIPFQLLPMHMAQSKGLNVDRPRNLAKSVTVE